MLCFVSLRIEDAIHAINALNGYDAHGSKLEVKFADSDAGPKSPKQATGATPSDNLYVRNLPPSFTEGDLRRLFGGFGEIIETRLLNAGTNEMGVRGMGALVRMASVDQAAKAIDSINGRMIAGSSLAIMVRFADTAEDKARRHQRQLRGSRYSPYPVASGEPGASPGNTHLSSTNSLPAGFTGFNSSGFPDLSEEGMGSGQAHGQPPRMDAGSKSVLAFPPLWIVLIRFVCRTEISFLAPS